MFLASITLMPRRFPYRQTPDTPHSGPPKDMPEPPGARTAPRARLANTNQSSQKPHAAASFWGLSHLGPLPTCPSHPRARYHTQPGTAPAPPSPLQVFKLAGLSLLTFPHLFLPAKATTRLPPPHPTPNEPWCFLRRPCVGTVINTYTSHFLFIQYV